MVPNLSDCQGLGYERRMPVTEPPAVHSSGGGPAGPHQGRRGDGRRLAQDGDQRRPRAALREAGDARPGAGGDRRARLPAVAGRPPAAERAQQPDRPGGAADRRALPGRAGARADHRRHPAGAAAADRRDLGCRRAGAGGGERLPRARHRRRHLQPVRAQPRAPGGAQPRRRDGHAGPVPAQEHRRLRGHRQPRVRRGRRRAPGAAGASTDRLPGRPTGAARRPG